MRNYIETFLLTFHAHKEFVGDVDSGAFFGSLDDLTSVRDEQTQLWEGIGWTVSDFKIWPVYWKFNKAKWLFMLESLSHDVNLLNYSDPEDDSGFGWQAAGIVAFESPRDLEKRRFRLCKL